MFNYIDETKKRKLLFFIVFFSLIFLIIIILSLFLSKPSFENQVIIENLSSCTNNISDESKEMLQKSTYNLVDQQNILSSTPSETTYNASIRNDSCKTSGSEETGFSSNIILDIEDLNYSFEITFYWKTPKIKNFIQNAPLFYCLDDEQMIYDPFNCEKNPLISEKQDPLFSLLPYFAPSNDYKITAIPSGSTKSGYAALITYLPCEENCREKTAIKEEAEEYLKNNGIILENYIIYEKNYVMK